MDDPERNPASFLGAELRRARVAAGFSSQDALAAKLGYDRSVIAKAETGDRPPTSDVLGKWIDRWSARADDAAQGLGQLLEALPEHGVAASDVAAHARAAREQFLAGLLEPAEPAAQAG